MKKIGILGGGVWGSALAKLLSNSRVCIFARDEKVVNYINEHKFNPKLKYTVFNDNVTTTLDITNLQKVDYLIITLPSQNIREVLKKYSMENKNQQIIIASKGIEIESKLFLKDSAFFLDLVFLMKLRKIYQLPLHSLHQVEKFLMK